MRNPEPSNYFASKYSLPHAAAVMVVRGATGHRAIDDAALRDPAIAALRARVAAIDTVDMRFDDRIYVKPTAVAVKSTGAGSGKVR